MVQTLVWNGMHPQPTQLRSNYVPMSMNHFMVPACEEVQYLAMQISQGLAVA